MNINLLLALTGFQQAMISLLIVCGVALFIAWIVACIMRIQVWYTYKKYNKIETSQNIDTKTNAEYLLKMKNITDVKVEKCGFWRSLLGFNMQGYGNSYSPSKKKIFLRKNIIDKATITGVSVGSQRVGHAVLHSQNDKKFKLLSVLRPIYNLAPLLFFPFILVISILDLVVFKSSGLVIMIGSLLAFLYLIGAFICMLITIPVEKKANKIALEALKASGLYTEEEINAMEVVLASYIKSYIADFIYAVIELIWEILKILTKIAFKSKT